MLFLKTQFAFFLEYELLFGIPAVYLVLVYVLSKLMGDSKQKIVGSSIQTAYNAFQVVLNCYMAWGIFGPSGFRFESIFGINETYTAHLEYIGWVHFWSKYIDFIDTLFIILNKSWTRLTLLHVYHHASIPMVWGYLLREGVCNGTALFGAGINSIIHILMYSHYLITSLGIQNPFKSQITQAQLIQFFLCEYHVYLAATQELSPVKDYVMFQLLYHLTMIALFSEFYYSSYMKGSQRPLRSHSE